MSFWGIIKNPCRRKRESNYNCIINDFICSTAENYRITYTYVLDSLRGLITFTELPHYKFVRLIFLSCSMLVYSTCWSGILRDFTGTYCLFLILDFTNSKEERTRLGTIGDPLECTHLNHKLKCSSVHAKPYCFE